MFSRAPNTVGLAINGVEKWRLLDDGTLYNIAMGNVSTVAELPAASAVPAGTRGFVTNASSIVFHSTLAASGDQSPTTGPYKVPIVSDGTNWLIG